MKKILLPTLLLMSLFASPSIDAAITGKLDLSMPTHGLLLRELYDGSWMAGISKDVYEVSYNNRPVVDLGYAQVWRVLNDHNNGTPSNGLHMSIPTGSLGSHIVKLNELFNLPHLFIPFSQAANLLGIDAMIGYSPVHTKDQHDFFWGVGAKLNIPFSDILNWLQTQIHDV